MRTGAGVIKYAVFIVSNRFKTYSNSIDCTIKTFDVLLCKFFFHNVACANFFYALLGLCNFFYKFFHSPPPPPPPPPRDKLLRPLDVGNSRFTFRFTIQRPPYHLINQENVFKKYILQRNR